MTVDRDFVKRAHQGRCPETRFRFAEPCVESGCTNWVDDRCDVVEQALRSPHAERLRGDRTLPRCSIRSSCRWFAQRQAAACAVCPIVVHTPDADTPR
jgi:hypothetical protein